MKQKTNTLLSCIFSLFLLTSLVFFPLVTTAADGIKDKTSIGDKSLKDVDSGKKGDKKPSVKKKIAKKAAVSAGVGIAGKKATSIVKDSIGDKKD